ncbi:MoaD/ThiS family protein [Xanthomonas campestris]|jgi:molybdopterin synthase sulfur carrier subunit|uniref:Molybdopterin synthase sulfur carrier subunit n=1 Tax=Xanthomonas campestris pv. campestris (strain B100) TaxID=509169 RepID=B0RTD7_XANCB|nr:MULTISPECIES: MoaD/ThiS family protein [Xanthomonas]MBF9173192.1 MoaD/ThiS family protein [Xanthomonas campestris pv. campestris]MCC3256020.1 MoaD/ThiS family protein [Xanthomonas campestris pv. armoraciae]MCC5043740.1 MoaD/ThiS family protein [Xanthomonas campestris]MCC5051700.1 MoaD/ThiS family protein [Xanthomonas campestris pv. aberrans]MCC5065635.1 MoaD/ThiS family protein [Xanthomonas campestris pv. raphani]
MSATITVLYFASLREAAGIASEQVHSDAADLRGVYAELDARHGLRWTPAQLRVAVDGAFARWDDPLRDGSEVVFIPPVSGG